MKLVLDHKTHLADNAWQFRFKPEQPVNWTAGQFIRVGLKHAEPDAAGTTRWFTIAAAPYEGRVTISTRLTDSSFKQALNRVPAGGSIDLVEMPAGDFVWRPAPQPHVFAAQGIGITPFYAIMKDRSHHGQPIFATLIYGHQPGSAVLFEDEINTWASQDPTLQVKLVPETLKPAHIAELAPDFQHRLVYVSGPKSFVSLCMPPHNLPLAQLKQDNFPGYAATAY
jgi:ferredoxin-NADP reductase